MYDYGVMLFVVGLVVFNLLMWWYIGSIDLVVGILVVNCVCVEVIDLVGFFSNMLVMCICV